MISSMRHRFWVDENLPPALARELASMPNIDADHFFELGHHETPDREVFFMAREQSTTLISKDVDFANLVDRLGSPPQVIWVRSGNMRTSALLDLFKAHIAQLIQHLDEGAPLIALEP